MITHCRGKTREAFYFGKYDIIYVYFTDGKNRMIIITWIVMLAVLAGVITVNKEPEKIQYRIKNMLTISTIFFLIDGAFFVVFSRNLGRISVAFLLELCMLNMVLIILTRYGFRKTKILQNPKCLLARIWIFITPVVAFCLMEAISNPDLFLGMEVKYKLANIVILGILFVFAYYVCLPYKFTIVAVYLITVLFGVANYCVTIIRNGNSILPSEIAAARTAMNVASGYSLEIPDSMKLLIFGMVVCCGISLYAARSIRKRLPVKARILLGCVLIAFSIGGYHNMDLTKGYYNVQLDFWYLANSYHTYGAPMTFLSLCQGARVQEPSGYRKDYVAEIYQEYKTEKDGANAENKKENRKPTVIAIMNESLSDLDVIRPFEATPDYLSFWHSFEEPIRKGNLLVPVYGGGTCNTEFEFLTGMSMGNLPRVGYPYQQYSLKRVSSLAREFKNHGYDTVAIHPGEAASWNRKNALLNLGFDKFYSLDDFQNQEYIRYYVSDRSCYDKIIEEFEKKEREQFIFAVTIQNHGSYDYLLFPEEEQVQLEGDLNGYSDAKEYMSLVQKSDEALAEFIAYLKTVQEPVILCVFGDHQPFLNDEFYEALYGKSLNDLSDEERERKYITPYLIWANYDTGMEQSREDTSANFLGTLLLETVGIMNNPFYSYIHAMRQEVTAMNPDFYRTGDNCLHSTSEQENGWLKKYQILQYYEMFDK